jgi:NADH-quinone oxidoreductase subunit C
MTNIGRACVELAARLAAIPGATEIAERRDGLWMSAPQLDVEAMAREMNALGYRLGTMTGVAGEDGETTVIYHYSRPPMAVNIKTRTRGGALPSVALIARPASWAERELHDFFAVTFPGHPNLAPLLRPPQLTDGFFRDAARAE